jgi:hypothetical protein
MPRTLLLALLLAMTSPQDRDGVIEVTVRDPVTREAIPAARVTVTLGPSYPAYIVTPVFTDVRGNAVFRNLPYGVYSIGVAKDGYGVSAGGSVFVRDNATNQKIDVELRRNVTLTGRVLNANGTPIVGARIALMSVVYRLGLRTLTEGASRMIKTDDTGAYRFSGLPPGEYYLRVDNSEILDEGNAPDTLARSVYYPGVSGASAAVPLLVRDQDLSGIDIRFPTTPVFKISGTLAFSGVTGDSPPSGLRNFHLGSATPNSIEEPPALWVRTKPSQISGESLFEIRGVAPGDYFLYPLSNTAQGRVTVRTLVHVEDRNVEGLRIVLQPMPEIKGRIVISDSDAARIQWDSLRVVAMAKEQMPLLVWQPRAVQVDPKTREFTLLGLTDGVRFGLGVGVLPPDAYVSDLRQGGASVYNDGAIQATTQSEIEIMIRMPGGTIEGVVRNASGQSVPEAGIALVPSLTKRGNAQLYKRMRTDSQGRFSFRGVAPGDYKLFAWPSLPRVQAEEDELFLRPYEALGTSVNVTAGAAVSASVPLLPFQ